MQNFIIFIFFLIFYHYIYSIDCKVILLSERELTATKTEYANTQDDLKSLQSAGQIIGEVLRPLYRVL
ncbi:hypothetical protein T459_11651 [Capsicum annuum]|uniref:Uncharacterized protein n=1 Tax=Capsicum annuum TaxID=4072 RepID=A0A2G2ZMI6_CAPAN|nr:hypothetical protein T459_11651 [Capsicum annuum]